MRGNAFEQKKKKHGLRINSGSMRGGVGGGGGGWEWTLLREAFLRRELS